MSEARGPAEVPESDLCPRFRLEGFASTAELGTEPDGIIGQERAVAAMEFSLSTGSPGYNVYVAGPVGTGRSTFVKARLGREAAARPTPPDWCYVMDFAQPERPRLLSLPPGKGRQLQRDMEHLASDLRSGLQSAFEGTVYEGQRDEVGRTFQRRSEEAWTALEREARQAGFALQRSPGGIVTVPLGPQGQPLAPEVFELLPDDRQEEIRGRGRDLEPRVAGTFRTLHRLERETKAALADLDRRTAEQVVEVAVEHLRETYADQESVLDHLAAVARDVADHLDWFREGAEGGPGAGDAWQRYRVNVFVDNGSIKGAPVIAEPIANLGQMVGRPEFRSGPGGFATDFTLLRAGVLQRASGGYLVLQLRELLEVPGAYEALKRALRDGCVRLMDGGVMGGPWAFAVATLSPEPMPLDVKVVLIGPSTAYHVLLLHDEDFRKLFKVKVEFAPDMPASPENLRQHAVFVADVCRREGTPHLSAEAVGRLLEYSARLAEDAGRLSARFSEIVEAVLSSGILARAEGADTVSAAHVARAIRDKARRAGGVEDRLVELTRDGVFLVSTAGAASGQANGLTVLNMGDHAFGRPVRITARTWAGRRGVVHVERETQMSGPVHSKGVLTVAAYLSGLYGSRQPLCLSASLAMEQTYEGVEGDSASAAELCALLSELADVPLRQDLALTGSVNQKGEIQPIGGVNEKIEGFYRTCAAAGLTGSQGVLIPSTNLRNLVLDDEVVAAVREGRFHVWSASRIDEAMELLTGVPAGASDDSGAFPAESIHGRVAARLARFAEECARLERGGSDGV